jgi:hypothetical protein
LDFVSRDAQASGWLFGFPFFANHFSTAGFCCPSLAVGYGLNEARMLSPQITSALKILDYRSASVQAVMNASSSENRFTNALMALSGLAEHEKIPIAIVGGLAAIHYGYPAVTEDIDIAVGRADLEKLINKAVEYGFKVAWKAESGWHTLEHGDVEINVVPEGGKAKNDAPTTIPGPIEMGVVAGIDYADLPHWIELKISSNRRKDQTHIVEVLKVQTSSIVEQVERHLRSVHEQYLERFRELAQDAQEERNQEKERGSNGI